MNKRASIDYGDYNLARFSSDLRRQNQSPRSKIYMAKRKQRKRNWVSQGTRSRRPFHRPADTPWLMFSVHYPGGSTKFWVVSCDKECCLLHAACIVMKRSTLQWWTARHTRAKCVSKTHLRLPLRASRAPGVCTCTCWAEWGGSCGPEEMYLQIICCTDPWAAARQCSKSQERLVFPFTAVKGQNDEF